MGLRRIALLLACFLLAEAEVKMVPKSSVKSEYNAKKAKEEAKKPKKTPEQEEQEKKEKEEEIARKERLIEAAARKGGRYLKDAAHEKLAMDSERAKETGNYMRVVVPDECPRYPCPRGMAPVGRFSEITTYGCPELMGQPASFDPEDPESQADAMNQDAPDKINNPAHRCCVENDICMSQCGMINELCDQQFKNCVQEVCHGDIYCESVTLYTGFVDPVEQEGEESIECARYRVRQNDACMCVPVESVRMHQHEHLTKFMKELAPGPAEVGGEVQDEDSLLDMWAGREPELFRRLYSGLRGMVRIKKKPKPETEEEIAEAEAERLKREEEDANFNMQEYLDDFSVKLDIRNKKMAEKAEERSGTFKEIEAELEHLEAQEETERKKEKKKKRKTIEPAEL